MSLAVLAIAVSILPLQGVIDYRVVEDLRIEGADHPLTRVQGFAILPDGSIVVGQPQVHEVWRFDSAGGILARMGREGRGPGEFRTISFIHTSDDSIFVRDVGRTHVFHADTLVRVERHWRVPGDSALLPGPRVATFGDGSWLVIGSRLGRDYSQPVPIFHMSGNGATPKRIGILDRADALSEGRDPDSGPTTYIRIPVHAGELWAAVNGTPPGIGILSKPIPQEDGPARATLTILTLAGDTLRTMRFSGRSRRVPPAAYDSIVQETTERARRGRPFTEQQVRRTVENAVVRYAYQPLFDRFLVGTDGSFWLGQGSFGRARRTWYRYTRRGEMLGRVTLPSGDEILAATPTALWLLRHTRLGEPIVVRGVLRQREPN